MGSLYQMSIQAKTVVTGSLVPGSSKGLVALSAIVEVTQELILPPGRTRAILDLALASCFGSHPAAAP